MFCIFVIKYIHKIKGIYMFWFIGKKVRIGSWINSSENFYGRKISCEVDRIYLRSDKKYCRIVFELNGVIKKANVKLSSCSFDKKFYI
jgi:hypothetical protein